MVAGHAVVVACSASQDLAQEFAGLNKHGHLIRIVTKQEDSFLVSTQTQSKLENKAFIRP
jgi:hypothetical protein